MNLDRRDFFRMMGVTGVALATGTSINGKPLQEDVTEFKAVLYDSVRCKGCHGCEIDCADANGLAEPPKKKDITGPRKTNEKWRTVVNTHETSKGKVSVKMQCMHCNEPACAAACLTKAMYKTVDGPVVWREDKCMGCRYCMVSCPFDMPKFEYNSPKPIIQKCTMCFDTRVSQGEIPACVENCPNEALTFGTRRDMIAEAHKRIVENPDDYVDYIYGENEAGGTGWLYLSPVPFEELQMKTGIQHASYPALTSGFLYSVPSVFVLVPALLLGMQQATKSNNINDENDVE